MAPALPCLEGQLLLAHPELRAGPRLLLQETALLKVA